MYFYIFVVQGYIQIVSDQSLFFRQYIYLKSSGPGLAGSYR